MMGGMAPGKGSSAGGRPDVYGNVGSGIFKQQDYQIDELS